MKHDIFLSGSSSNTILFKKKTILNIERQTTNVFIPLLETRFRSFKSYNGVIEFFAAWQWRKFNFLLIKYLT